MQKFEELQEKIQNTIFMIDDPKYLQRILDEAVRQKKLMETSKKWKELIQKGMA